MSRIDEARKVFARIEQAWNDSEQTAMLTITQVKGSAYRLPGAKMMMTNAGKMLGTLSGGCLESDLYGWAEKALEDGQPQLVNYDLSENELWSLGIGCKGTLEVLIQPIHAADPFWSAVRTAIAKDTAVSLAIELPTGTRVLFDGNSPIAGEGSDLPAEVVRQLVDHVNSRTRAEVVHVDGRRFYVDTMRPNEHVILCGAGHDAVPVAALAEKCGFRVTVLDPRKDFNQSGRFPTAEHLIVEPSEANRDELRGNWWLIMNHLQNRDEAALNLALQSDAKFIGVLGPLSRTNEMLENIGKQIGSGPIHAPIGLDVGAETIDEVAVSIVSELLAERSARLAKPLHGSDKIHG